MFHLHEKYIYQLLSHLTLSAPHDAPSQFCALVLNSTAVYLNWSSPHLPYGVIISYTITYIVNQSVPQVVLIPGNRTTNYTVESLNEDTVYTFMVHASTRIGAGPSAAVTAKTDEDCELSVFQRYACMSNEK